MVVCKKHHANGATSKQIKKLDTDMHHWTKHTNHF